MINKLISLAILTFFLLIGHSYSETQFLYPKKKPSIFKPIDKTSEQKIRVGLRQTQKDPFDWFKDKSKNQVITVKVVSTDNKGLTVRPEGCEMDLQIKKSAIAINAADARPSRWTGGEKLDCAIADLDLQKRKVSLSIKLLEEIEKKEALEKYGTEGSGKNLPFSSLSEDLKKKEKKKD